MPRFSQFSALWPWKRTIARSGEVAATTGGTEVLKPCGSSTTTYVAPISRRVSSVRSCLPSFIQPAPRNSIAGCAGERSASSRRYATLSRLAANHCGNW